MSAWGNYSEIISAAAACAIVVITFFANRSIHKIAKYSNRQNDRAIIEDIFEMQREAQRLINKPKPFLTDEIIYVLMRAEGKANLYGLSHIELHLRKIRKLCSDAWVIYFENHDDNGARLETFSRVSMKKHYEIRRKISEYLSDNKCYQSELSVMRD